MLDDRRYQAAVTAAMEITDMLGPWPAMERPFIIGKITFLLLDLLKQQAASGIAADAVYFLD